MASWKKGKRSILFILLSYIWIVAYASPQIPDRDTSTKENISIINNKSDSLKWYCIKPRVFDYTYDSISRCHWTHKYSISVNALRWATLTPEIGFLWHIGYRHDLSVRTAWTSGRWHSGYRRYALWEVSPEFRWYFFHGDSISNKWNRNKMYVGAQMQCGKFNYKFHYKAEEGFEFGLGALIGYWYRINDLLSIDFHAGLGMNWGICADYYRGYLWDRTNTLLIQIGDNRIAHRFGLNHLGIEIVWDLGTRGKKYRETNSNEKGDGL